MLKLPIDKHHSFAEVIESSLYSFTAQSWEWDYFPSFGSLVTIHTQQRIIFGIVHSLQTGSMDPGRYPFTYKKTEEELRAEQPHIFEFLQTKFSCLTVGFYEKNDMIYQVAPEPPKMHAFVSHATTAQQAQFFTTCAYLHLIFNGSAQTSTDELLLALLRKQTELNVLTQESLFEFIDTVCLISGDDYRRLKILVSRSKSFINHIEKF